MPRRRCRAVEVQNLNQENHGKKVPRWICLKVPSHHVPRGLPPDLVSAETAESSTVGERRVRFVADNPLAKLLVSALKAAISKLEAPIGERLDI